MIRALPIVLLPLLAHADLGPRSTEWDGLSRWVRALEEAEIAVRTPDRVELAGLPADSGLALVGAETAEDLPGLRRFVEGGGRLLLAAEGPEADPLLQLFDAHATDAPSDAPRLGDHPALRVVATPGRGPLFRGVRYLVTNRPTALAAASHLSPQVTWTDGTPFAFHLRLGKGEVILVGDASLLINLMVGAGDNARFAANLGGWLSRDGAAPVYVLGPDAVVGPGAPGEGAPQESTVARLNRALAELAGHRAPDPTAVYVLLAALLTAALAYLYAVFPGADPEPRQISTPLDAPGPVQRSAGQPGGPAGPDARSPSSTTRKPA